MTIALGDPLPALRLPATGGRPIDLAQRNGRNTVLYFYPKDSTPGCTQEGQDFRDLHAEFLAHDTDIFGVSRDSLKRHDNFRSKHQFPFELLSDEDQALCQAFGVIKLKKLYGREYLGVDRSTFLFDATGRLVRQWRGVKVKGHVAEVLAAVQEI